MTTASILPFFRRDPETDDDGFARLRKEVDRVFDSCSRGFPGPAMESEGGRTIGRFAHELAIKETR